MDSLKILAVIFAAGGLLLLGIGGYVLFTQYTAMQQAVTVNATIESATLKTEVGSEFAPSVVYRYQYDGQTYENDDLYPGVVSHQTSGNRAFEISHEYGQDDRITAYVNPDNPSESFLIDKYATRMTLGFIGGGIFITGLSLITLVWHNRREQLKGWLERYVEGTN
ncbi:MAG: DUF3592 domain-containing protein [Halorientalis sp.]